MGDLVLTVTGDSFNSYDGLAAPFIYTGTVTIDWGDGDTEIYNGGVLSHNYSTNDTYEITISGNITALNQSCFMDCTNLTSVVIPSSVTTIDDDCFASCTSLTSITIPSSVTRIGVGCFVYCTGLTSITMKHTSNIPSYNTSWLYEANTNARFYIPHGTTSNYTSAGFPSAKLVEDTPYSLDFSKEVYYACNSSATITATLTANQTGVSGETVTLTGTGSSITATTDSSGVATFNLSNLSNNANLTVTWGNYTDTAVLKGAEDTLNSSLACLGHRMAYNLTQMGVLDADASDGLTTLAGKILDVEPSISGLDLDTAMTLSSSSATIDYGQSVTLSALLSASYDDETLVNVDLYGVLQGANVTFKEGDTVLGSGVTDTNGVATLTLSSLSVGTHTVKAVFSGTDNFNDCESSTVSIVVNPATYMTVTSSKDILSYVSNESAVLTATLKGSDISGKSVVFKKGSTVLDTVTTDSSGVATYTYTSQGVGDITLSAEYDSFVETCDIEDCIVYDDCTANKTSDYSVYTQSSASHSFTYDSTNKRYVFTRGGQNDRFTGIWFGSCTDDELMMEIVFTVVSTTSSGGYNAYGSIVNQADYSSSATNGVKNGTWSTQKIIRAYNNGSILGDKSQSSRWSNNTKYKIRNTIKNGEIKAELLNGATNTNVFSHTYSSTLPTDTYYACFDLYSGSGCTTYIHSIKFRRI